MTGDLAGDPAGTARAEPPAVVVGAGGLLGKAVVARLRSLDRSVTRARIPWGDPEAARATLRDLAAGLPDHCEVYWCAGAGVVATGAAHLAMEVDNLAAFLATWRPGAGSALFLASSAGGVYAGSSGAPFTETTPAEPNSPYGHAKLRAERVAAEAAAGSDLPTLIGRISNLYGPGQDIAKPQGLVSHLCRACLTRQPLNIYVPLDTRRDYLFVADAAAMVVAGTAAVRWSGGTHVKVLASEQSTTVGALLGGLNRVTRRRPPVVLGASPSARFQAGDLRLRSTVWPPLQSWVRTPLPAGIRMTLDTVGAQLTAPSADGRRW